MNSQEVEKGDEEIKKTAEKKARLPDPEVIKGDVINCELQTLKRI